MCLTEAGAGTDLGLLKTRAVPNEDGTYAIEGTKIFISSGDHDFTENIVHLVLARLPDAPAGTRGISLFAVPSRRVAAQGKVGVVNHGFCDGMEEKMGLHGNATCLRRLGGAQGRLVGGEHRGLAAMFVVVKSARGGTGIQALGIKEWA